MAGWPEVRRDLLRLERAEPSVLVMWPDPHAPGHPAFVGTESFDPALGYAVPPGQWAIRVVVGLRDDDPSGSANNRAVSSPMLPFTITAM